MKLYKSAAHFRHWVAYAKETGWVMFPDKEGGWEERKPARGVDPLHLREVPLRLAARTGLLEMLQGRNLPQAA